MSRMSHRDLGKTASPLIFLCSYVLDMSMLQLKFAHFGNIKSHFSTSHPFDVERKFNLSTLACDADVVREKKTDQR